MSATADPGNSNSNTVNLVVTTAPLLSGSLRDCATDDSTESCSTGGVAAVQALVRQHAEEGSSTLVIPMGDFKAPLTTISRFYFGVNLMIYGSELNWRTWTVPAYTLWPDRLEEAAVYHAQEPLLSAVISNVVTNPTELWHSYVKSIHWDEETKLAVLYLTKEYLSNTMSQVESTDRLLQYIAKRNAANQCSHSEVSISSYAAFQQDSFSNWWRDNGKNIVQTMNQTTTNGDATNTITPESLIPSRESSPENCFLPVVVFDDKDSNQFKLFLDSFNGTSKVLVPSLIVDIWGHLLEDDTNEEAATSTILKLQNKGATTWVVSYLDDRDMCHQVQMQVAADRSGLDSVSLPHRQSLKELPQAAQTAAYFSDLDNIRQYAKEAYETQLVFERGVPTSLMPASSDPDGFRHCFAGECALGNLCADALRWHENADVAFLPSFLFDGPGWQAGKIRTLELLENVPYTAQRCGGTVTGHSLLRILSHSISEASFGGYDGVQEGGKLLQVSGMRISYNDELDVEQKILSVDVHDEEQSEFLPLDRTKLYTWASNTHLCNTFDTFPAFVNEYLVEEGGIPAEKRSETDIKDDIRGYLLSEFSDSMYEPKVEGRLTRATGSARPMELIMRDDCAAGTTYWSSALECMDCPTFDNVAFSKPSSRLKGRSRSTDILSDLVTLSNGESFNIEAAFDRLLLPSNVEVGIASESESPDVWVLKPNESLLVSISYDPSNRIPGTDTSTLVFEVYPKDNQTFVGCSNLRLKYNVVAQLSQELEYNHLEGFAAIGFSFAALVILTSLWFVVWVWRGRRRKVVATLQPVFLVALAVGVLVIGASLITLSIDDGVASDRGCDIACNSTVWLLSLGFNVSIASLFSKLWRINRVVRGSEAFRRVKISERDVIRPTVILLSLNVVFLLVWTIADPMTWERFEYEDQPWNTFGRCSLSERKVGTSMLASILVLTVVGFVMTCCQAFKARNISGEFSESSYLGIAVYSWLQLMVVGVPVYFLVDDDNVVAKYLLKVGLLLAVCMSMLLVVFVPLLWVRDRALRSNPGKLRVSFSLQSSRQEQSREMAFQPKRRVTESKLLALNIAGSQMQISSTSDQKEADSAEYVEDTDPLPDSNEGRENDFEDNESGEDDFVDSTTTLNA